MDSVCLLMVNLKNMGPFLIRASYSPYLNDRSVPLVFVGEVEVKRHILSTFIQIVLQQCKDCDSPCSITHKLNRSIYV